MKLLLTILLALLSSAVFSQKAFYHARKQENKRFIEIYEHKYDGTVNPVIETISGDQKFLVYPGIKDNGLRKVLLGTGINGWVKESDINILGNSEAYRSLDGEIITDENVRILALDGALKGEYLSSFFKILDAKCELVNSLSGKNYVALTLKADKGTKLLCEGGFGAILLPSTLEYGQSSSAYLDQQGYFLDLIEADDEDQEVRARRLSQEDIVLNNGINWEIVSELNKVKEEKHDTIPYFDTMGKTAFQFSLLKLERETDKIKPGANTIRILIPLLSDKTFATKVLEKYKVQFIINIGLSVNNANQKVLIFAGK